MRQGPARVAPQQSHRQLTATTLSTRPKARLFDALADEDARHCYPALRLCRTSPPWRSMAAAQLRPFFLGDVERDLERLPPCRLDLLGRSAAGPPFVQQRSPIATFGRRRSPRVSPWRRPMPRRRAPKQARRPCRRGVPTACPLVERDVLVEPDVGRACPNTPASAPLLRRISSVPRDAEAGRPPNPPFSWKARRPCCHVPFPS